MRLRNVKMGKKLTGFLLLVGLVPLILAAAISYWTASDALTEAETQASEALES